MISVWHKAVVVALALVLSTAGQAAEPLKMGNIGAGNANLWPVLIGVKKGFYVAEGLDVDIIEVPSSAALVQQLAAGSLDVSMSSGMVDIIRAIDKGAPLALIRFEAEAPPYALVAKASIKTLKELKGKTISIGGPKDITRIFLERMLAPAGVTPGEYDLVFAGATAARASALFGGAIDATLVVPPFNFQAQAAGFNQLGLTIDTSGDLPFSGTLTNRAWAATHKDTLAKLLRAQTRSIAWFYDVKNKAEAIAILGAESKIKVEDIEKSYDFYRAGHYFDDTGKLSKHKLGALLGVMRALGDLADDKDRDRFMLAGVTQVSD